jgi:hypothetical protein
MRINRKRYIKIGGMVVGSLLAFVVVATLSVNFLFKDELIQIVMNQLKKQIDAKVTISKIDFSLWKQFPNVSVQFDRVYAQSSNRYKSINNITEPDTLLLANELFFEFNFFKLIKGEYELKRVYVKNGYVKLKVDKEGIFNYEIIKPAEKKSSKEFNLELKDLLFTDTKIEYHNMVSAVRILGMADRLRIVGNLKSKIFDLKIQTKMFLNELAVRNYSYIIDKPIQLTLNLFVNDLNYKISDAELRIHKLKFTTNGEFILGERSSINLKVIGKELDFNQVIAIMPEGIRKNFDGYALKGKANIDFSIAGSISKFEYPRLNMGFTLNDANVLHLESGIKLKNLDLNGSYSFKNEHNLKSSSVKINKVSLNIGSGKISGDCSIETNAQPIVKAKFLYNLNLNELKQFFKIDTLEVLTGTVEGSIALSGTITKDSNIKFRDINDLSCTGQLRLQDVGLKIKNNDYFFERINGDIAIDENLNFKNISLFVHDNDFMINGSLLHWTNYLLKQQKDVTLQADVTSRNLDLSKYFVPDSKKSGSEYSRELLFPDNLNLEVKLNVNKFKLNKFNAKWASGYLNYKPKIFVLKALTFETMDGRVTGNGAIIQDLNKNFIVKGQVDISKLDIKQLFFTFNNFSQKVLLDKHLKGKVSGKVGVSSEWNNALYLNKDKILVDADVTIENGELSNFEPMMSLSKFIAVEELKNIKFSTLKNRIFIKDKQIVIPQMEVYSSAFDITASGVHLFDNHYNYRLKVLLSDILWGKAKRAKRENEEFGTIEDDGLGKTSIPISITGFNSDYKISYDSKKALDVVKESFKNQKKEIRSALNEEFGWFKNDTTFKKDKVEKKKTRFKVEWDDSNDKKEGTKNQKEVELKKGTDDLKPSVEWDN